jgi:predicted mannosyl-3-phosphoglycerate phosphatase (HAD superfamily)
MASTRENDMTARDTSHLVALMTGLSRERQRLAAARTEQERALRTVWVRQSEKEINAEERFLGMTETDWNEPEMSADDLMAELMA